MLCYSHDPVRTIRGAHAKLFCATRSDINVNKRAGLACVIFRTYRRMLVLFLIV